MLIYDSIVAVHGLDGHWQETWTHQNGVFWLRDLLPKYLPSARIYSYGYDSRTHASSPITEQFIDDFARSLVSELAVERQSTKVCFRNKTVRLLVLNFLKTLNRPIIFIVHSLGGLVVKSVSQLPTLRTMLKSELNRLFRL